MERIAAAASSPGIVDTPCVEGQVDEERNAVDGPHSAPGHARATLGHPPAAILLEQGDEDSVDHAHQDPKGRHNALGTDVHPVGTGPTIGPT